MPHATNMQSTGEPVVWVGGEGGGGDCVLYCTLNTYNEKGVWGGRGERGRGGGRVPVLSKNSMTYTAHLVVPNTLYLFCYLIVASIFVLAMRSVLFINTDEAG